jgi:ABC-type antimicrobial peptide transport system permease subunit
MAETLLLGLIAGGVGICSRMAFVGWLGEVGVPAVQDVLVVLFSGPRLYPGYGGEDLALGLVSVLSVSLLSTLYPAALASRVEPVVAMQGKE